MIFEETVLNYILMGDLNITYALLLIVRLLAALYTAKIQYFNVSNQLVLTLYLETSFFPPFHETVQDENVIHNISPCQETNIWRSRLG